MDQKTIIEGLTKALTQGKGDLNELDKLLTRAKVDVEKAIAEQKEAEEKAAAARGQQVAAIANRLLVNKLTADDMAYIFNSFFGSRGLISEWTAQSIEDLVKSCAQKQEEATKNASDFVNKLLNNITDVLADLVDDTVEIKDETNKKTAAQSIKNADKSADQIISDFLKKFGLN